MKNKVDKGFELVYLNLSYRRRFIRTLWQTPFIFLIIGFLVMAGDKILFNRIAPILLVIGYLCQLIYNYIRWKNDEKS